MSAPPSAPYPSTHWRALADRYRTDLCEDTLPFWLPACVAQNGGFGCFLDQQGRRYDRDKGVWHQGRFTWLLGTLAREVERRSEWVEACEHGVRFLREHCVDPSDGRYWFHLDGENRPLRKRRYVFSEAFAAQAFAAHGALTGDDRSAQEAFDTFERMTRYMTEPGLLPAKSTGVRPLKAIGPPMIRIGVAQALRALGDDPRLDAQIDRCVEEIERDFVHADRQVVFEVVSPDGAFVDCVEGRTLNPGHALEAAWFLFEEARHRGGDAPLVALACRILDWSWGRGWDPEHGGLLYFVDVLGHPVQEYWHDMKFWWTHNEAVLATLMAYAATGEERYAAWHAQVHRWAHEHFADPEHGEWFGYLHRDGSVSSTAKGNLWKGPFHLPRMQLLGSRVAGELAEGGGG